MKGLITLTISLCVAASAYAAPDLQKLAKDALSSDSAISQPAIAQLRDAGPEGLQALLDANANTVHDYIDGSGANASAKKPEQLCNAADAISQQKDSVHSALYWYTDLEKAKAAARASGKPILSLRLLGKLCDEYSCANSRFFRTVLYANTEVSSYLRDHFVLHWESVRPVPRITIDFGDGRKLERTVTGNSIHYVLDSDGHPIDGIPGLYGPQAFLRCIKAAEIATKRYASLSPSQRGSFLADYHRTERDIALSEASTVGNNTANSQSTKAGTLTVQPGATIPEGALRSNTTGTLLLAPGTISLLPQPALGLTQYSQVPRGYILPAANPIPTSFPTAGEAAQRAMSKSGPELPLVRAVNSISSVSSSLFASGTIDLPKHTESSPPNINKLEARAMQDSRLDEGSKRLMAIKNPSASKAGSLTTSKILVESPLIRSIRNLEKSVAEDTVLNEYKLHIQLHDWFINGSAPTDLKQLNEKVYGELFLTPSSDPWLGLAPADTYTSLQNEGLSNP